MGINSPRDEFLLRFHRVGRFGRWRRRGIFLFFLFVSSNFVLLLLLSCFLFVGEIMRWVRDSRETLDDGYWEGN